MGGEVGVAAVAGGPHLRWPAVSVFYLIYTCLFIVLIGWPAYMTFLLAGFVCVCVCTH